ncbi:hypothetical protein BF93_11975 [Brachybacterium phenoliresistens]|uniref:Uncharacterized protein n=1 Tax=Brachybacterium phenoliresistens TaxID=396014 RepID=Z9JW94_9MICO|nr:hypothetical protein [Brachybacterium phenoliresistens]EWS82469.1 hypothetical protein BF93_11975 [Brachybacterium phenoliresistens]
MAVLESRPFLAPASRAVHATIEIIEPAGTSFEDIGDTWEPGQRIVLRCRAELAPDFWEQTRIDPSEPVLLVGIATCLPARARWRSSARFEQIDGAWRADTLVEVDGSVVAVEVLADAWVVGPGRTGSEDPSLAIHEGAKLWQLTKPSKLELESDGAAFPTTAISFAQTGRRDVPWTVELAPEAEPFWKISSSVRLYINTDSDLAPAILDGSASEDLFALMQCDIHLAVMHSLAKWRDSIPPAQMMALAEEDVESLASFGANLAQSLGLPLSECLRLAREEPLALSARSREALSFGRSSSAS